MIAGFVRAGLEYPRPFRRKLGQSIDEHINMILAEVANRVAGEHGRELEQYVLFLLHGNFDKGPLVFVRIDIIHQKVRPQEKENPSSGRKAIEYDQ